MVFVLLINVSTYNTTHIAFIMLITPQETHIFCRFLEDWQTESLCLTKLYLKVLFVL